ncbi:MAG: hypothetical protein ACLT33_03235 [Lachnospira pectinoschiza]
MGRCASDWILVEGERPASYIIICSASSVSAPRDEGIAAQTILLAANEVNLGGCRFASVNILSLTKNFQFQRV